MGVGNTLSPVVVRRWARHGLLMFVAVVLSAVFLSATRAQADPVPEEPGFYTVDVFGGYSPNSPITGVRFAPDGRAFVIERRGRILVFDSIADTNPDIIDMTDKVHGFWDRGLLGLAVDPNFPAEPWIYVFYTRDGSWQDRIWGSPDGNDGCPSPPGATDDGCVVKGRLSRMKIDAHNQEGPERVLLDDRWCFQFPSHSADDLAFGDDGMLYLSAGDGASFGGVDYGQFGGSAGSPVPQNPCDDPPTSGTPTGVNGQGGMLRSQDIRTTGDPLGYNGSILRIHPDTGYAAPGNPLYVDGKTPAQQPARARMLATGLRNPYRMAFGPGGDLFVGDVGWGIWEEINRIQGANGGRNTLLNFGWPCYEGREDVLDAFDNLDNNLCESLYDDEAADHTTVAEPMFEYRHGQTVWPGAEGGTSASSAISAIGFMTGGSYPSAWQDALIFGDFSRKGVWALKKIGGKYVDTRGTGGAPDIPKAGVYLASGGGIVDIQPGPGGDLYLVDLDANQVFRLRHTFGNVPPTALINRTGLDGTPPRTLTLSGAGSTDPDGAASNLTYKWDLDNDGAFDDAVGVETTKRFTEPTLVSLKVTDPGGKSGTDTVTVLPPNPTINKLSPSGRWRVGEEIKLRGVSSTSEPDRYLWTINLHHCAPADPNDCHAHHLTASEGKTMSINAPDHSYPSYLEAVLRVEYPDGIAGEKSRKLHPATSEISVKSPDVRVEATVGGLTGLTPVTSEAIENGVISISTPESFRRGGRNWVFDRWSDGGERARDLTVPSGDLDLIVRYDGNRPPVIGPLPDATVEEGTNFQRRVKATDSDGDDVTFSLVEAPQRATINANTGDITWTPTETQAGETFTFRVKATDDWSRPESTTKPFRVRVVASAPPPTTEPPTTEPPPTTQPPPTTEPPSEGPGFIDAEGSVHERDIEALAASGITFGCNPPENSMFCPEDSVTRAQMASFLTRGLDLPPGDTSRFSDVAGSVHEADIGSLAEAGITLGCNPPDNNLYCPDDPVTRAQMASFLTRGLKLPPGDASRFSDVGGSVHEADIGSLAEAGITLGCNPPDNDLYCPEDPVTRAQMASFLVRGLDLPMP